MSQITVLERELEDTKIALCNCSLDYVISVEHGVPDHLLKKRLERLTGLSKRYNSLLSALDILV